MSSSPQVTRGLRIGSLLGAPVIVQPSALITVSILAYLLASSSGAVTQQTFVIGLVLALLFFASIFVHEFSHAAAARLFGYGVKEIVVTAWGGRTRLDEPPSKPLDQGVTAAVGPLASLALAGIALVLTSVVGVGGQVGAIIGWLGWVNLVLAIFNALPAIPLDGGTVMQAIVWKITGDRHRGTAVAAWGGRIVAIGIVVVAVAWPLLRGSQVNLFNVVWAVFIASILWPAASASLKYSQVMTRRETLTVASLMTPAVGVPYTYSVEQARQTALATASTTVVVLSADGSAAGRFPLTTADAVPEQARAATGLDAVLTPVPRGAEVQASLGGDDVVTQVRDWWGRTDVWVVRDGDAVVGIVSLQAVVDALK